MTQNHTKTPILLDPMLINLRHQLRLHFHHIIPLIANQSGLSIIQAKNLCHHINDAILIFLLKAYQDTPQKPNSNKPNHRTHHLLHETPIDTTTLTRLPKISIDLLFGNQSTEVIRRIATLSNLYLINTQDNTPSKTPDIATAQNISEYVATISLHHIDVLAYNGKLDDHERRQWFALQKVFLKDKINILVWAALAGYQLDTPQNHHDDYRKKLGKVDIVFDDSEYQLPNPSWLLNLATIIQEKHQKPLRIGHITHLKLNTDDKSTLNPSTKPTINPLVVIAAILLALVAVVGISRLFTKKQPAPIPTPTVTKPTQTKTQALGHQDIAVIRVDDDKTAQKTTPTPNNPPKKDESKNQGKQASKQASKDTKEYQNKAKDTVKKETAKPSTKQQNTDQSKKQASDNKRKLVASETKTQGKNTPNKNNPKTTKDKTANKTAQDKDKKTQNNDRKKDAPKKASKQNQSSTKKAPSGSKVESVAAAQKTTKDKTANKTTQDKKTPNNSNAKNQQTTLVKTTPANQPAQQKSIQPVPTTPKTSPSSPQKPTESVVLRQSKNNPNSYHNNTATPSTNTPKNNPNPPNHTNPTPPSKNKPDE